MVWITGRIARWKHCQRCRLAICPGGITQDVTNCTRNVCDSSLPSTDSQTFRAPAPKLMENPCSNTIPCSNTFAALNYLTEENLPAVLTEEQRLNLPAVRDSVPKSVSWAGARLSTVVLPVTLATIFEEDECDENTLFL